MELKRGKAHIETLGREVELVELSYRAQMEMMKAYSEDNSDVAPIMIKHGVVEFADKTIDEIATGYPFPVIIELSDAVQEFSGLNEDHEKN